MADRPGAGLVGSVATIQPGRWTPMSWAWRQFPLASLAALIAGWTGLWIAIWLATLVGVLAGIGAFFAAVTLSQSFAGGAFGPALTVTAPLTAAVGGFVGALALFSGVLVFANPVELILTLLGAAVFSEGAVRVLGRYEGYLLTLFSGYRRPTKAEGRMLTELSAGLLPPL